MNAADYPWDRTNCTTWCNDTDHHHDPACWGVDDDGHMVPLSMGDGFPREAVEPYNVTDLYSSGDVPTVAVYPYRGQPGYREVVYLHLYRPTDNEHRNLDCSVHLTGPEAVTLARYLLRAASAVEKESVRNRLGPKCRAKASRGEAAA